MAPSTRTAPTLTTSSSTGRLRSYGSTTASTDAGIRDEPGTCLGQFTGLAPSTTYHFQLVATNSGGTTDGGDLTFATAPPPAPTVTGVSPSSGPTAGGTPITITGTSFGPGSDRGDRTGQRHHRCHRRHERGCGIEHQDHRRHRWRSQGRHLQLVYVITSGGTSGANTGANFTGHPIGAIPTVSAASAPSPAPTRGGTDITVTGTGTASGALKVEIGQGSGAGVSTATLATNVTVPGPRSRSPPSPVAEPRPAPSAGLRHHLGWH